MTVEATSAKPSGGNARDLPRDVKGLAAAGLFVLLWSTGFIGAKLGVPHADPLTFLALRFVFATGLLLALALATRAPWPRDPWQILHLCVAGVLLHTIYLGGVYVAMSLGVEAGHGARARPRSARHARGGPRPPGCPRGR
jgi:hypothetical protein